MIDRNLLHPQERTIYDAWSKAPPPGHTPSPSIGVLLEALCDERRKTNALTIRVTAAEGLAAELRQFSVDAERLLAGHVALSMRLEEAERECPRCEQPIHIVGARNLSEDAMSAFGVHPIWSAKWTPRTRDRCASCGGDRLWQQPPALQGAAS